MQVYLSPIVSGFNPVQSCYCFVNLTTLRVIIPQLATTQPVPPVFLTSLIQCTQAELFDFTLTHFLSSITNTVARKHGLHNILLNLSKINIKHFLLKQFLQLFSYLAFLSNSPVFSFLFKMKGNRLETTIMLPLLLHEERLPLLKSLPLMFCFRNVPQRPITAEF